MNAVITGATKGIGRAIAIQLAKAGYHLSLCARNEEELKTLRNELMLYEVKVEVFVADCSIKEEVVHFCENTARVFDRVDVLVNNVGIFLPENLMDEPDENFEMQQQLNLNASYYCAKFFGRIMRNQRCGHIFNICSVASKQIIENAGSYSVTKSAMLSLNHVLRKELSKHQVKVTAILPGATLTDSWTGTTISPERFVQPEDIAKSLYAILNLSKGVNVDEIVITPLDF